MIIPFKIYKPVCNLMITFQYKHLDLKQYLNLNPSPVQTFDWLFDKQLFWSLSEFMIRAVHSEGSPKNDPLNWIKGVSWWSLL